MSFKKTMVDGLSICKILARRGLQINFNESRGIDAFLTESCPDVVQALYLGLLSLKLNLST
jgi:hypothetical protein